MRSDASDVILWIYIGGSSYAHVSCSAIVKSECPTETSMQTLRDRSNSKSNLGRETVPRLAAILAAITGLGGWSASATMFWIFADANAWQDPWHFAFTSILSVAGLLLIAFSTEVEKPSQLLEEVLLGDVDNLYPHDLSLAREGATVFLLEWQRGGA
ncbi:MAG: hypothetical protein KDD70_17950 [Bdellovibrionales bacterium]|nr:hypothetical protein [Bdellovibrionales bacterium]